MILSIKSFGGTSWVNARVDRLSLDISSNVFIILVSFLPIVE